MLVLVRRQKQDGRRLNLGMVAVDVMGAPIGQDFVRSIKGEKRTSQTCNMVERLYSVEVTDDKKAVDALLYLSGQSNFATAKEK